MQVIIEGGADFSRFKHVHEEAERVIAERRRAAAEGEAKGKAEGKAEEKILVVKNMLADGTLSDELIMRFAEIDRDELDKIKAMM